ncbi:hypothetical protein [Mesorhizobium sp. NPDC059025]|uniref:hypothetical protein n=1 Tax=unclassified Mesorhizobium TaxID=325217 RepID=UPI003675F770
MELRLMTVRQAIASVAACLLPVFICTGRTLSVALVMMAVAISSTGWAATAVLPATGDVVTGETSTVDHQSAGNHDHGGKPANSSTACKGGNCGSSHHQPQDLAQTCCAMACHTAILSVDCVAPVSFLTWQVKHRQWADVLEGSATLRLERPPRPLHA